MLFCRVRYARLSQLVLLHPPKRSAALLCWSPRFVSVPLIQAPYFEAGSNFRLDLGFEPRYPLSNAQCFLSLITRESCTPYLPPYSLRRAGPQSHVLIYPSASAFAYTLGTAFLTTPPPSNTIMLSPKAVFSDTRTAWHRRFSPRRNSWDT